MCMEVNKLTSSSLVCQQFEDFDVAGEGGIGQGSLVGRLLSPGAASLLLLEHQVVRLILKNSNFLAPIYTL